MRIFYASEAKLTPKVLEILSKTKDACYPDVDIEMAAVPAKPHPNSTVLAFGPYKQVNNERVVQAPSVPQILSKADILTRLTNVYKLLLDPPVLPEFDYVVIHNLQDALNFLASLTDRVIAFDLEVHGDIKVDLPDPDKIISISITGGGRNFVFPEELCTNTVFYRELCSMLMRQRLVITVNGKFDLSYVPDADLRADQHYDVQLAHYALFPAAGEHGLKPTAKRYFGLEDWDLPGKAYTGGYNPKTKDPMVAAMLAMPGELVRQALGAGAWMEERKYSAGSGYERIPRDMLYEYNGYDTYATWLLYELMEQYLDADPQTREVFNFLMKLSKMFQGVERRGITLDIPYLEELSKVLTVEKVEAEVLLDEIAGQEINPRSPKQVKEWFEAQGVPLKGTAEAVLTKFIEETDEAEADNAVTFASQLLVCRGITKQLGTYVDGYRLQAHGNTVYPGYKLHASTTGRLGGQGASMLTIPRDKRLKRMVTSTGEGYLVVGADASQMELRVMALESQDEWLISAFQPEAGDFFDNVLTQAYPNKDWFDLHTMVNEHTASPADVELYSDKRTGVKATIYGASFNRGVAAIAASLKIPFYEAKKLMDAFIRPGSAFDMWREDITYRALNNEDIVTRYGRHFQSELITSRNKQMVVNSAMAFTSQSTGNDLLLSAALEIEPQLEQFGATMMGTIHDAFYANAPEEHAEVVGQLIVDEIRKSGQRIYGDQVLFTAEAGWGKNLAEV